ncbi:hypothetical protein ACOMHN_047050 [Nucella lapillus]
MLCCSLFCCHSPVCTQSRMKMAQRGTIVKGRRGSSLLFDDFLYRVDRTSNRKRYWRCTKKGCPGTASTNLAKIEEEEEEEEEEEGEEEEKEKKEAGTDREANLERGKLKREERRMTIPYDNRACLLNFDTFPQ